MIKPLIALTFLWAALPTEANDGQTDVLVTISDIQKQQGTLKVALFTSPGAYDSKETEFGHTQPVESATHTVAFRNVPAGQVLVLLYHDLNDNGELDTNMLGIPKEPYASSTGKRGRFGPPSWQAGAVPISQTANRIAVSMK